MLVKIALELSTISNSFDSVNLPNNLEHLSYAQVVRWGRSVYANIQKFIQFQLTVNVAALIINVVAAISSGDVPLNAVQVSGLVFRKKEKEEKRSVIHNRIRE